MVVLLLVVAACGGEGAGPLPDLASTATTPPPATDVPLTQEQRPIADAQASEGCADVIDVDIEATGVTFRISTTVRSADTGWEKYADAWEVRDPSGLVLGERVLAHPHVEEQPFTRSLSDVEIPPEVVEVEVAARDSAAGFCGATLREPVPGRS
jgi:hypothetical protein